MDIDPQLMQYAPLVAAILQIVKKIPQAEALKPYMPFVAMAVSFGILYATGGTAQIVPAIIMGLMASGLYSGVKALGNGPK